MNEQDNVIEVSDITVHRNQMVVLDHVSLCIRRGEFAAVVGPNGAGKTTLVRAILGLVKPETGSITVFGHSVEELGSLRSKIGYVPQIFAIDLNFPVNVYETVIMGLYGRIGLGKRPAPSDHQAALQAIQKVGIEDLMRRPIARLSAGQRQRAFVARALANEPELLVLDEPTTGVDAATTFNLFEMLKHLKREGVTILLVTHDIGVVATYTDTVACLNRSIVAHCQSDDPRCVKALKKIYGSEGELFHHEFGNHFEAEEH